MEGWMIFSCPAAVLGYGAAGLFFYFDAKLHITKGCFTIFSAVLAILSTAYLLVMGADMWEAAVLLMLFVLLNMGVGA